MKKFLLLCFSFGFALSVWAQDRVVTGKVTSTEDGSALPGVNVVLKGTTSGTVTDANGSYSITVPSGATTLTFSFIGYKSTDVAVGEKTVVDVLLSQDVAQLSEVVVTAVGISRETKTLGYSIARVNNETLNQGRVTNAALALSGKVSGLQINQTDNGVNNSPRIVLRGNRSFVGNNQALVVVDGVQVDQSFINSLNPLDIESVTVLKGSSAAALYGSSAANGVLVYTTKLPAKNRAPEVTFSTTTQLEKVAFLPNLQKRFGSYGGESFGSPSAYTLDPNFTAPYISYENQNYGPEFNGAVVPLGYPLANGYQQYETYSQKYNDHLKFWDTGVLSQNDITVSASSDKSAVHVSFQDMNRSGTTPGDKYRRDIFRINGSTEYGKLRMVYKAQYSQGDQNTNFAPGGSRTASVYWLWMNTAMNLPLTQYKDWRNTPTASPSGWYDDFYGNPYWALDNNRRSKKNSDFVGNLELSYQATKWLNLLSRVGITTTTVHQSDRNAAIGFDPSIVNPNSSRLSTPGFVPAGLAESYYFNKRINVDLLATIDHDFTQDLKLKVILGANIFDDYYNGIYASSPTLQPFNPAVYNLNYRNGNLQGGNGTAQIRRFSEFVDATLGYKFATLHGSYRNDNSSLLKAGNNSFSYPAVDAAFVISDAFPSIVDNSILSFAKIGGGWAQTGNISVNPYALQNVFGAGPAYSSTLGTVPTLYQGLSQIAQNLKPEFTVAKEVNLEVGFWGGRANLKTSFYQTNTTAQTVRFGVSSTTGYNNALVNTGEMLNKGLEYDFTITPVQTSSGLKWNFGVNYTDIIANKVLSVYSANGNTLNQILIPDNSTSLQNILTGSQPTGNVVNSYAIVGSAYPQLQTTDWQRDPANGKVIVDAITGTPLRDPNIKPLGQTNPQHRLGISNTVSFKGLSLYFLFDYRAGYVIYNQLGRDIEFGGLGYYSASAGRQPYVFPNSEIKNADGTYSPNTNLTVPEGNISYWTSVYSGVQSPYVTKGDFWKLREVSLSYTIPQALLSKAKVIKSAKVSITGRNLLMWRPKSNQWTDPEFAGDNSNANGTTTTFQNPPSRLYGANLTFTF